MSSLRDTRLKDTLVSQLEGVREFAALPPAAKEVIYKSVEQSSTQLAPQFVNEIDTTSNKTLNDIPKQLVGTNNPVNVVSGNLNTNDLSNTLNDAVGSQLTQKFSGQLTDSIFNSFVNNLPSGISNNINLGSIKNLLSGSVTGAVSQGVSSTITDFSADTLSGKNLIPPTVADIGSFFSRGGSEGLTEVNKAFDSSITNQAFANAQKFDALNSENREKLITQTTGFIDPTATYPTKEYAGRSETNKLAQGEVTGTIVQKKEQERLKGIQLPNNESWEQPQIPYKGEYPYNKVIETESGHIIEIDDTPGCERLHVYHKSGTFIEIDPNGSITRKTKGSSYEIIDKNGHISVTGDANLSVKGTIKIFVGGNADIEVEGDTNVKCFNDITMEAAGRVDISAAEEINLHSANVNIEADINLSMKGDVNAFLTSTDVYTKANSSIYHEALSAYNIKATSDVNIDGNKVYLNSGKAAESKYSASANIGILGDGRKDVVFETIPNPVSPTYLDKFGYAAEDTEIPQEADNQAKELKQLGITTNDEINQTQIPIESETPKSQRSGIILPSESLLQQTYLPDNFQLSQHFTLAQVSSKAVVTNNPVVAQLGLSYGQIVYNLQGVALNVLEPLLALYPNMFVTSGFRRAKNSSSTSDHPRGKAVDIQFKNVRKSDYYEIAKKLATNLNYDKLLLEYKTYGTGLPWIHISFDVEKPRQIVLTYLNDKKYGNGLTNLA